MPHYPLLASQSAHVSLDDGVFPLVMAGVRENDLCQLASGFQMNIQNNLSASSLLQHGFGS